MIIPPEKLTESVLVSIVESFVTREGTDYGDMEYTLEQKVNQVLPKVYAGEIVISYDEASESVTLVDARDVSHRE